MIRSPSDSPGRCRSSAVAVNEQVVKMSHDSRRVLLSLCIPEAGLSRQLSNAATASDARHLEPPSCALPAAAARAVPTCSGPALGQAARVICETEWTRGG